MWCREMTFVITARSKDQQTETYLSLDKHALTASIASEVGLGTVKQPYETTVTIKNDSEAKFSGVIHIELPFEKEEPSFFLPAFMYGRNRGEAPQKVPNEFPRLREGDLNRPSSPWWMVRSDRLSHPVALAYDNQKVYGLSASPYFIQDEAEKKQWHPSLSSEEQAFYQYAGFTCNLNKGTVGYTLGYENAPWLFIQSQRVLERAELDANGFELASGETVTVLLKHYAFEADSELDINPVIEEVYHDFYQPPRVASDEVTTATDLAKAIYEDGWQPDDLNYACQVHEDEENGGFRYVTLPSISWTNGLPAAVPILMTGLRLGHEGMQQQALSCIENIVAHSINPDSKLPYEVCDRGEWSNKGWWFDEQRTPGHSSYIIGQALYYILKAYAYDKRFKGVEHEDWLVFVKDVLERLEKTKNSDHEYPYILSEKTGAGLEYDAFSGTWCMAALAYYAWLTEDNSYLSSLKESEAHYYRTYVSRMECYGGPLDTDKATDSEGILAYLKALKYMHLMSEEDLYIDHMKDALAYEFSFKFGYNSPVKVAPLDRVGWSSSGGSVTSIANPHVHPMSSNIVDEILYYLDQRSDDYVKQRLADVIGWGCQTYNRFDREYDYGKKGWMSERFCHSEGLVTQPYPDGTLAGTWFCLMPWASASVIEGLTGDYWDRFVKDTD